MPTKDDLTVSIEVELTDIKSNRPADGRGRIALGPDFADKKVTVAIVAVFDGEGDDDGE